MTQKTVHIGDTPVANDRPFTLFAGMNVLESRDLAMQICGLTNLAFLTSLKRRLVRRSFDKANRSSVHSYRGPGMEEGLKIFEELKR
ncbi:3-deoxy-8-phosphooctulonate synthase, partial [Salinivibrio sp. MA427]